MREINAASVVEAESGWTKPRPGEVKKRPIVIIGAAITGFVIVSLFLATLTSSPKTLQSIQVESNPDDRR